MIQERNSLFDAKPIGSSGPIGISGPLGVSRRLSVSLAAEQGRLSLRVRPTGRERAGKAFGCPLPAAIGEVSSLGTRTAICLGPDEWMLLASAEDTAGVQDRFSAGDIGSHSLVDVGHRELGIEIEGSAATLALSSICALDLEAMPAGSATRTILDKSQVVLLKHSSQHYRIDVWQSFAGHVWGLLSAVSREITLDL